MVKAVKPSLIVFDFDGTLAQTDALILAIYNKHAAALSLKELTEDEVAKLRDMPTHKALRHMKLYWYKIPKLWRIMTHEMAAEIENIRMQPGIAELLHDLAQKKIDFGIISSNSVQNIDAVFRHQKLPEPLFIGSSSALFKKHKVLKKICKQHNLDLSRTLYVGDESRDIELGHKLNIPVISVSWGFGSKKSLQKAGAMYLCDTSEALKNAIEHLLETH